MVKLKYCSNSFIKSSSHIGSVVGGLIPKEENVEHEVSEGPKAPSFEGHNPEQGKLRRI
jgi:hypothetical protein